ncbi:MAG: hypothetical protein ACYDC1_23380, partial [Limisphaerales bacterium]
MKAFRPIAILSALLVAGSLLVSCGRKESDGDKDGDGHDHGAEKAGDKDNGQGHGEEESPSGASFKASKGVIVTEETKKLLGVEVTDVT